MTPRTPDPELQPLLDALVDGLLTEAEERQLAERLKADASARRQYLDLMSLSAELQWEYGSAAMANLPNSNEPSPVRRSRTTVWGTLAILATLAASLLVVVTLRVPERDAVKPTLAAAPARVVHEIASVWEHASSSSELREGTHRLMSGVSVLQFACGAEVTLSAPAEIVLESPTMMELRSGRVTVRVPEEAVGFRIRTPASDFVDLGTEFGLIVGDDGTADAQVFQGVVVAKPLSSDQFVTLRSNEAVRVEPMRGEVQALEADVARFRILPKPDAPRQTPSAAAATLPRGARVVFLGDRMTDIETHILLVNQAFAALPADERPRLFNAGETMPNRFQPGDFKRAIQPLKPTHAVLEFGTEAAAYRESRSVDEFASDMARLVEKLQHEGIAPILELGYPLTSNHSGQAKLDGYNQALESLARTRGLRVIDPQPHFRMVGEDLITGNGVSLSFAGYRALAAAILEGLGYATLSVPESLQVELLPGVPTEWKLRVQEADQPDSPWQTITLPQPPDRYQQRLMNPTHSATNRDRLRGFVTPRLSANGQRIEALAEFDSPARTAVLNLGGIVKSATLNGVRVYNHPGHWLGMHAGRERIPVQIQAGKNTLLLETTGTFFASVTDTADWPLPTLP